MFDFTSPIKRKRVQAVLTNRVNQKCLEEMHGSDRASDRTAYVQALAVIPGAKRKWLFEEAFPALSRDISPAGLSLLHNAPLEGDVLVEFPGENATNFVRCSVQHCNDLGYGYWQIGLKAEEIVGVNMDQHAQLQERMDAFASAHAPASTPDA